MADLSLSERLADTWEKVSSITRVVMGIFPGGPFRFGTADVRGVPTRVFLNLPITLGEYYRKWFETYGPKTWLVYEDERYTFTKARQLYLALGMAIRGDLLNIKPGQRVGIAMRNYPELLISFLAITAVGGVAIPLNAMWRSEELEYAVLDAECKLLICDPERLELCVPFAAKNNIKTILCRGEGPSKGADLPQAKATNAFIWDTVIANGARAIANVVGAGGSVAKLEATLTGGVSADDEAMLMYTSGSTGKPKGVIHTQRSVGTAMKIGEMAAVALGEAGGGVVQLMAVPLFHITALCPVGLFSIPGGQKVVMMRKWEPGKALEIIQKEGVTRFTGVPTMMKDLMEHPSFSPEKLSTLKGILAGGAPVPPAQVAQMRAKTKKISSGQGYGLTESMGMGTVNRGADYLRHPTSCGKPVPLMVEVGIIDPVTKKKVKEGERGEVCLKGAIIMKGYNNLPEKTTEALDDQGYFHTGDIGKMEGGFVYILDRMKDLIIRGGENIDCSEVEAALNLNAAVRECSVFGLPDERLGEVVGAAIWSTDSTVSKEDIIATAAKTLAKFKVPAAINVFMHAEALPKGATGKLDKKGLRDHYGAIVKARDMKAKL